MILVSEDKYESDLGLHVFLFCPRPHWGQPKLSIKLQNSAAICGKKEKKLLSKLPILRGGQYWVITIMFIIHTVS